MDTGWLKQVTDAPGPYVSVHMDVTRGDFVAAREVKPRWAALRRQLLQDGANAAVVDTVGETMLGPTGLGGPQGRSIVANADGILMDQVLSCPPAQDEAVVGPLPSLLPAVRGLSGVVPHAIVAIDRTGADISVVGKANEKVLTDHVQGEHDVIHKVSGTGGWSHKRLQMRAEDSWERNATAVADRLDGIVGDHNPQLVLLTGDDDARSYVWGHASGRVKERLVDIEGSGRADGVHSEAFHQRVEDVLSRHRLSEMGELVARYEQAAGQGGGAAKGLDEVLDALRTGAVQTLLLHRDLSGVPELWAGDHPLQVGSSEGDVRALGSETAVACRADLVLVRAAVGQGAAVEPVDGVQVLDGGVGALLRFEARPQSA